MTTGVIHRKTATIGSRMLCAPSGDSSRMAGFVMMADAAHVNATTKQSSTMRRCPSCVPPSSRRALTISPSPASVVTAPAVERSVIGSPRKTAANAAAISG